MGRVMPVSELVEKAFSICAFCYISAIILTTSKAKFMDRLGEKKTSALKRIL
jgi:hypothetical protein